MFARTVLRVLLRCSPCLAVLFFVSCCAVLCELLWRDMMVTQNSQHVRLNVRYILTLNSYRPHHQFVLLCGILGIS